MNTSKKILQDDWRFDERGFCTQDTMRELQAALTNNVDPLSKCLRIHADVLRALINECIERVRLEKP